MGYLHQNLNRSALKYLDITPFKAAEGDALFLRVIEAVRPLCSFRTLSLGTNAVARQLFFDPDFEPGVMVGPDAMNLLSRMHRQQPASIDGVLSGIQVSGCNWDSDYD